MTAPALFISYSHDSPEHKDRILALADRLRQEGVDCRIDQYEQSPEEGWPLWCERQIERSTFVLVICTEIYYRRFRGEEVPHKGLGGTWEGHIITQHLYNAQGKNRKFIPVTFSPEEFGFIPLPLQSATAYQLDKDYEVLYRRLTGQLLISLPPLGEVVSKEARQPLPPQPSLERKQDFETLWHVRHRQNIFFTGREEILTEIRKALEERGTAALSGLGGVGKTQTAIEYAYRYRQLYRAVFWAEADSRERLFTDFVSMAAVLNLPSAQAAEQELALQDVKRWLESNLGWLLILDNADELLLVQEFLPSQGKGHLLLTTRARAVQSLAERIPVREMTPEEGALLLLRRAAVISKERRLADAGDSDRQFALQLSRELGGLPLALDQAGAFIEETQRSLVEYAEMYASEKMTLLAERGTLGAHASATVTFSLAFEKVARNSAAAADLIRMCAFLSPDAIPEEIFTAGGSELGENLGTAAVDKLRFARLIGEAVRFSLLDRDAAKRTLDIHRLVQVVIREGMPATDRRNWAERTIRATSKAFPNVEYVNWASCQKFIAHAQTCASLIKEWDFGFVEAADLLNQAAMYLFERALFAEAEPLFQRSLAVREKALGPEHPNVAQSLNNLAELYRSQGKYAEADPLYQRSLAINEKALGPEHPNVAQNLSNLAALYHNQGKYAEAEPLYQRSLAVCEKVLGPEHPNLAQSLNNLAELYRNQGRYAEAEPQYQRSLAIWEKALGPEHPNVAQSLNNLALLYHNQGEYAEAEPLYQRSLVVWEKALGPEHPNLAQSLNNLAELYRSQGKYAEAEPLHQRSLAVREKTLGPEHPNVAESLNNLALLYHSQGEYADAEPLYQRSLVIWEKALGPAHPDAARGLNNLAALYRSQGKYAEAEPLYQHSLVVLEKALGPEHPDVAHSLDNLAELYRDQGKYAEAEPLHQRSLAIKERQGE
jgi:tetratricopeptide (TPR) repeat protein